MTPGSENKQAGRRATVFLIEDNDAVRMVAELTLKALNYEVVIASCGVEALERWPRLVESVDLVITDLVMPGGVDGISMLETMRASKPGLKAIITTGDKARSLSAAVLADSRQTILQKPYKSAVLDAAIQHLIGSR